VAAAAYKGSNGFQPRVSVDAARTPAAQRPVIIDPRRTDFILLWWQACRAILFGARCRRHDFRRPSTRMCGLRRVPFQAWSIAPKVFQTVEVAFGLMKDMDNYLEIIEHDPLAGGKSINRARANTVILL
jgi:hypothetical protein